MAALDLPALLDTGIALGTAFLFGTLIGAERQYRQRTAGLRTNVLVATGAASFVNLAQDIAGTAEAVHVVAYVVSGIGFLGAGVIMKEGLHIRGLNTAATLWCSAAVGACAGTGRLADAALLTVFVLAGNTLLRPLVNAINRIPIDEQSTESTYNVRLTVDRGHSAVVRDLLVDTLEAAQYPVGDVALVERPGHTVDIVATLISTAIDVAEIDAVAARMIQQPGVVHATWESST